MPRPYKPSFGLEKAYGILAEERGTHFDPVVLDAFFQSENEILRIKQEYSGANSSGKYHFFQSIDFLGYSEAES